MPQLDEATLQAYLDGELAPAERAAVRRAEQENPRVARCLEKLRRLEAETSGLLESLDDPLSPEDLRVAEQKVFSRLAGTVAPSRRDGLRRAAGIALVAVAAGGLAVAAEPLRTILNPRPDVGQVSPADQSPPITSDPVSPESSGSAHSPAEIELTELGVQALSGELEVRIVTLRPGVRVTVDIGGTDPALIRAEARAGFRNGPGVIAVNRASSPVFVSLPPDLQEGTVTINGEPYVEVRDGIVTILGPLEARRGDTLVFAAPRRR